MKGKPFRDQDNRALHERRMKERARIVVTQKNIEYSFHSNQIIITTGSLLI